MPPYVPVASVLWEDVEEGQEIPSIALPITVRLTVLAAAGQRNFNPMHHDREVAQAFGSRDMFISPMHIMGLAGRALTDWTGPGADIMAVSIQIRDQDVPGDTVVVKGQVTRKYKEDDDHIVDLELTLGHERNPVTVIASGRMNLPSREGGPLKPKARAAEQAVVEPDHDMPDFAKSWLNKESPSRWGGYPITTIQIQYWCEMVEDGNPLYTDEAFAKLSRFGGIISPPTAMHIWTASRLWPKPAPTASVPVFRPPNADKAMTVALSQEYLRPMRPGDHLHSLSRIVKCSSLKKTRVGEGHFVQSLINYYNQRQELMGSSLHTVLCYR